MKTALHRFTRLWPACAKRFGEGRRRRRFTKPKAWRPGFGLPTGIALAVLAMAVVPVGVATDPSRPPEESGSDSSDKSESRDDKPSRLSERSGSSQFLTAYNSMSLADWLNAKGMQAEAADLYTEARDLFGKRRLTVRGGKLTDTLKPLETRVYVMGG